MSRLASHFSQFSTDLTGRGQAWDALWNTKRTYWDRGQPSPAIVDFLHSQQDLLSPFTAAGSRKTIFIPGCGNGYDVALAALKGFHAIGLEVSKEAVRSANETVHADLERLPAHYFSPQEDRASFQTKDRGPYEIIQGDFFSRSWEGVFQGRRPDVVYDYTFLCAVAPELRRRWAERMAELLPAGGLLVCLEFPMWKDRSEDGPPWGLNGVHWELLACGGDGMGPGGEEDADEEGEGDFERVLRITPERQLEISRGLDKISVWKRK